MSNKYIGVLGGMGYRATVLAYKKLNQLYAQIVGEGHSCPILLTSIDFMELNELLPYQLDDAAEKLLPYLLDMDGQDVVANIMINNTLHEAYDILNHKITCQKPFGHVGELLQNELLEKQPQRIIILGSHYTMNSGYFESFIPHTIEVVKVDPHIQNKLEELRVVYFNGTNPSLSEVCYSLLIQSYPHVNKFVIACAEHSLAFAPFINDENWIDTMDLQCRFALKYLLNN